MSVPNWRLRQPVFAILLILALCAGNLQAADPEKFSAGLGDEITLDVPGLKELKSQETATRQLTLYLDCVALTGVHPIAWCLDAKDDTRDQVRFLLTRSSDNQKQWQSLLRSFKGKVVPVGIGFADDPASLKIATNSPMRLVVFKGIWPWVGGTIIVALFVLLVVYAAFSNLLRDLTPFPESDFKQTPRIGLKWLPGLGSVRSIGRDRPPFSLGRVQMAWWFFIIAASYLFLWLVSGDRNNFNSTALTLLGISLGTGLVARAIDVSKQGNVNELKSEKVQLETRRTQLEAIGNATLTPESKQELDQIKIRLPEIDQEISDTVVPPDQHKSEGFLTDILSDENGISLHRFQMVGWTLILGLIFTAAVVQNLAMPDFDATLLGLMGISSGAFVGFKLPEKNTVTTKQ
jgi:hypothetical protein